MKIKKRPAVLSHSVNSGCNLRCAFCDEWKKNTEEGRPKDLPLESVFKIIDLAADFGITSYNAWSTEPLLRKDLPEIMAYAKSRKMKTFMITNGTLLKKRIHELKDVDYISVSVDGPTASQKIRGADYDLIMDGIRYAAQSGFLNRPILMNCVISSQNLDEVADLVYFAEEIGAKMAVEPIYLFKRMNDANWDDLLIRDDLRGKFEGLMTCLIDLKKQGYPLINSKTYLKQMRDNRPIQNCRVDRGILAIDDLSRMYHCRIHNKPLGNVLEQSVFHEDGTVQKNGITEIWNLTKKERQNLLKNCEGCQFFGYAELTLMNNYNIESFYGYEWL